MEARTTRRRPPEDHQEEGVAFQRDRKAAMSRRRAPTRTALVCPELVRAPSGRNADARCSEFEGLAGAIHLDIAFVERVRLREIRPATYVGGGFVDALAERVEDEHVELVLVDAALSPIQQRNLENRIGAKVLDRTALILEIFGERAASREGVLQVELAHLNYQKGRLVKSWTHLERQRGGGGFLGGPGETQIESDRRQIQDRIRKLEARLHKVTLSRGLQRKTRDAVPFPIVALVGYTNAGKSSLFNRLTGAEVMAKDLLFATLDTTVRRARLPHGRDVVLSDTVGFVADLPTDLIAAFRATLEEVTDADLILHVRDVANDDHKAQAQDVLGVLTDLGISPEEVPIIEVWNKTDLLNDKSSLETINPVCAVEAALPVSAVSGEGMDLLLAEIEKALSKGARMLRVSVPHENGDEVGWIYAHSEVISRETPDDAASAFVVRIQPRYNTAFHEKFGDRLSGLDAVT